tara:strand:- start:158 stop:2473 length:2316 start_codon:yes stop_codon:yes gene_type:complete
MASLTNQQSNTKSLTGLSDTYSTNIVCDTFEVSNEFTIDTGCIVNIPANSIPDSALSTNVALKNDANIFTNTNTFNDTVTISRTANQLFIRDPVNAAPSTISQNGNILNISSINGIAATTITLSARTSTNTNAQIFTGTSNRVSIGLGSAIIDLRPLICNIFGTTITYPVAGSSISGGILTYANNLINNGTLTNNGVVTNNAIINDKNTRYQYSDDRFVDVTNPLGQATQIYQNAGGLGISNIGNSQFINLSTRDSLGASLSNIICRNGNRIQLQGTSAGEIDITGTAVTLSGVCSFTNVTTPVITQTIPTVDNTTKIPTTAWVNLQNYITSASLTPYALLAPVSQTFTGGNNFPTQANGDNSTLVSTTAFVKNQAYAQLAGTQTFTGQNTFALSGLEVILNGGCLFNDILLGPSSTIINQSGVVCSVANNHDLGSVTLSTRTSLGIPRDNVYALNGNQGGLRGNSGNTIDITGTQATIGGTSVPVITTQPLAPSNTNEIASTAWVINKGYATTASLSAYALLTANQTFTGTQTCVAANNVLPIKIQTQLVGYTGYSGGSLICDAGAFNGVNLNAGNYSVIAFGTGIDTGAVLTLTTHASGNCGILISNTEVTQTVPFTCGYLQLGTPVTTKTNYQQGFIKRIAGGSFTGTSWANSVGVYNIMSIVWDGSNDYTLGVWQVDIVVISSCVGAPGISFCWNDASNSSMAITSHCGYEDNFGTFNATNYQNFRMSFVLNVVNLTTNYFLNCNRVGGSVLGSNTSNSYIQFTRLA